MTPNKTDRLEIRHLVLDGSSHWVYGRNVTGRSVINEIDSCSMFLPMTSQPRGNGLSLPLLEIILHVCLPRSLFFAYCKLTAIVSLLHTSKSAANISVIVAAPPPRCTDMISIINEVHKYFCGFATVSNMIELLLRTGNWCEAVNDYLLHVTQRCIGYRATAQSQASKKFSLCFHSRDLYDVVILYHFCSMEFVYLTPCTPSLATPLTLRLTTLYTTPINDF